MASGGEHSSTQMERLTTCPVCLDKFRTPKLLPCMHTFCLTPCLTNLVDPRARSLRCPECRRDHLIPAGGVQSFPANLTMIGFLDIQPTTTTSPPDRCFICNEQKQSLAKCHDCSKFICSDCREAHLREASYNISSLVSQLRRTLPKLSDKIASYEQRVNTVRTNHEHIQREITSAIATLIEELKHRETALFTEAEVYMQSQLRMFRLQQETAEVELASVASFCESVETSFSNGQIANDADLTNMRSQCNRYSQQIDTLQSQMPTDVQKLRFTFDNQTAISSSIQNFGRLIDMSRENQQRQASTSQVIPIQQPRYPSSGHPQSAAHYVTTAPYAMYPQEQTNQYRHLENLYYSHGSAPMRASLPSQTLAYRPTQYPFSGSVDNPFVDLSSTVPARAPPSSYTASWDPQPSRRSSSIFGPNPFAANNFRSAAPRPPPAPPASESSPRRNYVSSTTAARSLEGDDRPIFGGRGRGGGGGGGRGRVPPTNAPIQEHELSPPSDRPRRGTFQLDEPSLPNLPQSGAQRPRDTVIVQDLYNVRPRDRAQTPVAFTINLNEASQSTGSGTS